MITRSKAGTRSSELPRATGPTSPPPAPRSDRNGWDTDRLRAEVEAEFRAMGARVFREDPRR